MADDRSGQAAGDSAENGLFYPHCQYAYGPYIDEPVAIDVNGDWDSQCTELASYSMNGDDHRYFLHHNNIYSVYGLTDEAGSLVEAYEYDPYGKHMTLGDGPDADSIINFGYDDTRTVQGKSAFETRHCLRGRRLMRRRSNIIITTDIMTPA